jgi:uncharacterized protein YjbI with pentapeptide repeats
MRLKKRMLCLPVLAAATARGDVFQWQWVDPNDHSLGKTQSSILCPDGAGIVAGPGSVLGQIDLTRAFLYSRDLSYSSWFGTTLNDAYFGKANLYEMLLYGCSLRNADFTAVNGMGHFRFSDLTGANFTEGRLKHFSYSTLDNANFTRADLSSASFEYGSLRGANFTDAIITGTRFLDTQGFTQEQLHATASYKNGNLQGLGFGSGNDLSGWDFSGGVDLSFARFMAVRLTGASFMGATLMSADFVNADLRVADFSGADLTDAGPQFANLSGANFSGANLTRLSAGGSDWRNTNLTGAVIIGADMQSAKDLTAKQVYSTASYSAQDLRGVNLRDNDMNGWVFRSLDLTNSNFGSARLAGADFRDTNLTDASLLAETLDGADFTGATIIGAELRPISAEQLYSTASYHALDLRRVSLSENNMSGWDFRGVDLTGGVLDRANLQDADFTNADLTGARLYDSDLRGARNVELAGTKTSSTIRPDGTVTRFQGGAVDIRNYVSDPPISIHVTESLKGTTFKMLFDEHPWGSMISFNDGVHVDLSFGELWLYFDAGVDPSTLVGQTFQLFDWAGVNLQSEFRNISSTYQWDVSNLYTGGTVRLAGVPEPAAALPLLAGVVGASRVPPARGRNPRRERATFGTASR